MLTVPGSLSPKATRHAAFVLTALLLFALPWTDGRPCRDGIRH